MIPIVKSKGVDSVPVPSERNGAAGKFRHRADGEIYESIEIDGFYHHLYDIVVNKKR
jgi:hypothetical protein